MGPRCYASGCTRYIEIALIDAVWEMNKTGILKLVLRNFSDNRRVVCQGSGLYPIDSLTHWGRTKHICVGKLTVIGSDKSLSPERRQAIIWTNDGILSIGPLGTNFSETLIGIQTFSFKKMEFKMSSAK